MRLLYQGDANYKPNPETDNKLCPVGKHMKPLAIIKKKEIPNYCNDRFYSAYSIWNNTRLTKSLPFGVGWGDHPTYIISIITILQQEYDIMMSESISGN